MLVLVGFIYIAYIGTRGALYGYTRNGIPGVFLGLACGLVAGFLSLFVWAVILTVIFRISSYISRWCKRDAGDNLL